MIKATGHFKQPLVLLIDLTVPVGVGTDRVQRFADAVGFTVRPAQAKNDRLTILSPQAS